MISAERLTYVYPSASEPAVRDVTFEIPCGEIFGFLGPSGAGKSTTQRILTGLLKDYEGTVRVFDRDLDAWSPDYYERVGVSFELPNHYLKLTALENLRFFGSLYARETRDPRALLDRLGLADDAGTLVGQFSKGMKARLTIARALLHDPELLFLDEPTAGLDPGNARLVKDLVDEERRAGKTVFLTTHNMSVADELCDRVAFIVDGEIRLVEAPRDLKLRYGERTVRVEYLDGDALARLDFALEGLGGDERFLALLRGGAVRTIHTLEATLEDVFLRVTGRRLE